MKEVFALQLYFSAGHQELTIIFMGTQVISSTLSRRCCFVTGCEDGEGPEALLQKRMKRNLVTNRKKKNVLREIKQVFCFHLCLQTCREVERSAFYVSGLSTWLSCLKWHDRMQKRFRASHVDGRSEVTALDPFEKFGAFIRQTVSSTNIRSLVRRGSHRQLDQPKIDAFSRGSWLSVLNLTSLYTWAVGFRTVTDVI